MLAKICAHDYDAAQALGARLQPLADVIFARPVTDYRARTKEALVMVGALERADVRPPLLAVDDGERATIRRALQRTGLL